MSAATKAHPSLPAPVVHAGFSIPQSKSHVLAGVQDAYWSDDEAEDADCPLCLEEMDISDLNFKPCVCGYQICRFCWHHIKENLNKRCPACRRVYTDDTVEFKPINTQDHKRLMQQKKQRDREKKELETLGRRHLANVRVVQRNVVYVVGIGPRFAKEELIPTLRSHEYFGQYGKINKILLVKRNSQGEGGPVVGLYITYHRREDAARCIAAVDGSNSPGGGREVMRASYGTTKYCMTFLRGISCNDHNCMNLHEWGDEKDCFTKEDLTTLKHTMKATESRARSTTGKGPGEVGSLPQAASWGQRTATTPQPTSSSSISAARPARRAPVPARTKISSVAETKLNAGKATDRKQASSRPTTPSTEPPPAELPAEVPKVVRPKDPQPPEPVLSSPAPSHATTSDVGSAPPESTPMSPRLAPAETQPPARQPPTPAVDPVKVPAAPPGLPAPPGITALSRPPRVGTASPQTPVLSSDSTYQMSSAARQLLDDVKARREAPPPAVGFTLFPDFDRTLQTLVGEGGGGFSFNLDPKLADKVESTEALADFESASTVPFRGPYTDAFPALRQGSPYSASPGHPSRSIYDPNSLVSGQTVADKQAKANSYFGSFDPFAEGASEGSALPPPPGLQKLQISGTDEERKQSRFGFARGRQSSTAASSPLHPEPQSLFLSIDESGHYTRRPNETPHPSYPSSPSIQHNHSPMVQSPLISPPGFFHQPVSRQESFADLSEAQLRNFIKSRQSRPNVQDGPWPAPNSQPTPFRDPAIMSASFGSVPQPPNIAPSMHLGPPPGLSTQARPIMPPGLPPPMAINQEGPAMLTQVPTTQTPDIPPTLSQEDFPALVTTPTVVETPSTPSVRDKAASAPREGPSTTSSLKDREKAERKAAKKAAALEKALEKQKQAQEAAEAKNVKASTKLDKGPSIDVMTVTKDDASPLGDTKVAGPSTTKATTPGPSIEEKREAKASELERAAPTRKASARSLKAEVVAPKKPSTPKPARAPSVTPPGAAHTPSSAMEPAQAPLLSKKPKKNKPAPKLPKLPTKDDDHQSTEDLSLPSASRTLGQGLGSSGNTSRAPSVDRQIPASVEKLLADLDNMHPGLDLANHPFFDLRRIHSPTKMPLEYAPLVHALSALSVGGGSFASNMPTGSIDNAVSSFQQLLETLTQTISDLLRLLPRTTWDDSSSFDSVLRDMLKGDDFLDDGGEEGQGKEDEVAALTLALERRARWMEVQLSKLEELHRDINTAAVRAVMSFNDNGWDRHDFLPYTGNSLKRFDSIGLVEEDGVTRPMTVEELEQKLTVAKEAAVFAETEIREAMERFQNIDFIRSR